MGDACTSADGNSGSARVNIFSSERGERLQVHAFDGSL